MPDLLQIRNPRTGGFLLLDHSENRIIDHLDEARPGVPIAGVEDNLPAEDDGRPILAVLVWEDCRTSAEVKMEAPVRWKAVDGVLDPDGVLTAAECTASDTPGICVHLATGDDYYLANTFDAFKLAFEHATGARLVKV